MTLPAAAELAALPLHVIVRDYPETLAVLRRHGVDVGDRGALPASRALDTDTGALLEALAEAIAWRAATRSP